MRIYIVTGASGLLARFIIEELSKEENGEIYAITSNVEIVERRYCGRKNIHSMTLEKLQKLESIIKPGGGLIFL